MDRIPVEGATRAHIVSIHYARWQARRRERRLQPILTEKAEVEHLLAQAEKHIEMASAELDPLKSYLLGIELALSDLNIPNWANGVRVIKAGNLSWAVVATTNVGH